MTRSFDYIKGFIDGTRAAASTCRTLSSQSNVLLCSADRGSDGERHLQSQRDTANQLGDAINQLEPEEE